MTAGSATAPIARLALVQAVGAYTIWGFLPVYFNLLKHVGPLEVVAHRVIWSVLLLLVLLFFRRRLAALRAALSAWAMLWPMALAAVLIGANWLIYIWAVTNGQIAAASLGYFLNPLLNVLLGTLFLGERLARVQWLAVALAGIAVALLAWGAPGSLWISLSLALSFAVYGLVRKSAPVGPLVGLAGETILLLPLALAFVLWWLPGDVAAFGNGPASTDWLLIAGGAVTALPLLLFASAARQMSYATIGLIQYIGPTIQFLLAILVFGEALTTTHLVAFPLIWIALAIYSRAAWQMARPAPA